MEYSQGREQSFYLFDYIGIFIMGLQGLFIRFFVLYRCFLVFNDEVLLRKPYEDEYMVSCYYIGDSGGFIRFRLGLGVSVFLSGVDCDCRADILSNKR